MRFIRSAAVASMAIAALALSACSTAAAPAPVETKAEAVVETDTLFDLLPQSVQDAGELVVAGDSHPPYRVVGDDGKTVTGLDPEVWEALSKELGVPVRMEVTSTMPAILTGMQGGRWAAFNGPVQANAEREETFDTISWMLTRSSYIFPVGGENKVSDSGDLCGLRIAVTGGSITETEVAKLSDWCAEEGKPGAEMIPLGDTNATILAVKSGRADAAGMTETGALDVLASSPDEFEYVTQTEEQGSGINLLAMLVPKESGLGNVVFQAFERMFENGTYDEIMAKWGLENVKLDAPQINAISKRQPL